MWWKLLAEADPCALANLIQTELLNTCNDPNWLLHDARTELWTRWHHRAEPIISGVLRMTLDTPLDVNDPNSLDLIANASAGKGHGALAGLLSALIARADERPIDYLFGNADDSLGRDRMLVEELNRIARRQGMPKIGSSHLVQAKPYNEVASNSFRSTLRSVGQLSDPVVFTCGSPGIEDAIRALRVRGFYETHPDWSVERFANVLGYRILELMEADRERDAETIVGVIANAAMFDFRNELLNTLADGFDRHGKSSLAATTYTLAWILAWSRSDRVAFVGETEIDSLQNAIRLDRPCAEKIVGEEISRFVSAGVVVNGASRELIYGCLKGNLGGLSSASFDVWEEAYAVIAERIPRVASSIDPEYVYVPPAPDDGTNPPGDIDAAFAVAAVAGIAHPVREAKRRALAAVQLLIDQRATAAAAALETALS